MHGGVHREHIELVHFAEFGRQGRRCSDGANLPAGDVVGLAKAGDDECPFCQTRVAGAAEVLGAVIDHVLIHLVADQQHIGGGKQGFKLAHFRIRPDGGAGVVRAVDDEQARARRDGRGDFGKVRAEGSRCQGHAHRHAACQFDVGHIAVIAGVENDDFVARMHGRQNDGQNCLRGTCGNGDFAARVIAACVQCFDFGSNGFAQGWPPTHGGVLVVACAHGAVHGIKQLGVAAKIREALAQIDGLVFSSQCRHDGEDGGAHIGQLAGESRSHGSLAMHGAGAMPDPDTGSLRARNRPRCHSWRA